MAVAFDAVYTKVGNHNDFTHTPIGTPTLVVVSCHHDNDGSDSEVTAISYGGDSLTFHAYVDASGATTPGSSNKASVELWYLLNPSSGAQTVSITTAGTAFVREAYASRSYTGAVDQATPLGTVDRDSNTANNATSCSATVSSESDGLVVDALTTEEAEAHTVDSGQTERFQVSDSSNHRACGSTEDGDTSVTMGWSWTTVTRMAYLAVPINPGSSAPTAGGDPTLVGPTQQALVPLEWTASPDATGCYVQRDTSPGFTPAAGKRISSDLGAAATDYEDTIVGAETQYYYLIEWTNVSGSTYSNELAAKTAHNRPSNITWDTVTSNSIEFSFTRGFGADDAHHRVLIYEDDVFYRQVLLEPGDYGATVEGLKPGPEYTFKIQAYDTDINAGVGGFSTLYSEAQATILYAVVTAFELQVAVGPPDIGAHEFDTDARTAMVTAFELEVPQELRTAVVTAFELEVPDFERQAMVTAFELETEVAARTAIISAFELEVLDASRQAVVTAFELETESGARAAVVTAFELQVPDLVDIGAHEFDTDDRQALVTAFELEIPDTTRHAVITAFELEVPPFDRQAIVTVFELEVPVEGRAAMVTAFELVVPGTTRYAVVTAFELEVPNVGRVQSQPGYPAIAPFPVPTVSYDAQSETEFRRRVEETFVDIARIIQHIYEELS